jgi:hypothetical protein
MLVSDKVEFNFTLVKWDKEGHIILIKEIIHQMEKSTYMHPMSVYPTSLNIH